MRQILYLSKSTVPGDRADLSGILNQSRHNNAMDGITGLLWSDGRHFLQVFEGPEDSVAATFERIRRDIRHEDLIVLRDRPIEKPEFGGWSMVHRRANEPADAYDFQVRRLLLNASTPVREHFLALIATGEMAGPPAA
ncbi:MAG: BLUF domain-containing protein [Pseudomonadota bacterium]